MKQRFDVHYIAPSQYDDDGYVHRYWKGVVPSNSLSCLRGMTESAARRGALGQGVSVKVHIHDDSVGAPPLKRIIRRHQGGRSRVLVGFVGVQSNQFPRAADLALELRAAGVPVMIGGFHVSGMLAMFEDPTPDLQPLLDAGVTLVKGEIEGPGVMEGLLNDAFQGNLKPIYDICTPPDLASAPIPQPDPKYLKRFLIGTLATLDTSRGCPFGCTFCTIINVQGRKMRNRPAAAILKSVRENYERGVTSYFFTDDNLARSPVWEAVFDGIRVMRQRGLDLKFMMQVDTQAYLIPNFVKKAQEAGCDAVFVGMETVNPRNVEATGKHQNDVDSYAKMVQTWRDAGIRVHVGYIIGLPHDTPESVRLDVEVLRDVVKVDEASFFMLTPLPGSEDHRDMVLRKVPMDADLNNFDSNHETFRHPNFAPGAWQRAFREAWGAFYSKESIVDTLLRVPQEHYWTQFWTCMWYRWSTVFVGTHPMRTGLMRLKDRLSRRPNFPRENILRYGWRRFRDLLWGAKVYGRLFFEFQEIWMLTRRPDDIRWKTLADLRGRWAQLQLSVTNCDVRGRCEEAAREVQQMLRAASQRLNEVSHAPGYARKRWARQLRKKANELDAYARSFELQMPTWQNVVDGQRFIRESLVGGYEEAVIAYVARRRKFNAFRKDLIQHVRSGDIWRVDIGQATRVFIGECLLAIRFWFTALTQGV